MKSYSYPTICECGHFWDSIRLENPVDLVHSKSLASSSSSSSCSFCLQVELIQVVVEKETGRIMKASPGFCIYENVTLVEL